MSDLWAWRPFSVGVKKHKQPLGNTKKVLAEANRLRATSPLASYDDVSFAADIITDAIGDDDVYPSKAVLSALFDLLCQLYHDEALNRVDDSILKLRPNSRDAIAIREYLRFQIRFVQNYSDYMAQLQSHMAKLCRYLMTSIPLYALEGESNQAFLSAQFIDLLPDVPEVVEAVGVSSFNDDLVAMNLLESLRRRFEANVMNVSKIDPRLPPINRHRYVMPTQATGMTDAEIVESYLIGTPLRSFFKTKLPLAINEQARFEHNHILGGTGHGKTQFIQKWIAKDIEMAMQERRSIVLIDSQGDLINKIARLDYFNPEHGALKDKLVIIDPTDVQFPAAINMFALDDDRLTSYGLVEREKVQNSAISLYEHFFGELLGAELTAKQGVVFKYLARLMLEIPNATILTLRDLVDDPKPFIPYMDKLTGSARVFFAREFLDKSFNATRKQISKRLWGVLSTPVFERLFSSTETKIDLFKLMNEGHIILISTAKDLLKQDGASLYGRFFLSMIGQAIMERAVIPEEERTPTFLYVDECQDYFDETIELLLAQGRKYKISITLAHQFLDQLSISGRSSVLANTSIKAAGGMNAKDAKTLASEMRVTSDYLQSMKKTDYGSDFAFWMKHDLPHAIKVNVPFGHLERLGRMNSASFQELLERNRDRYCWRYTPQESSLVVSFPGMETHTSSPVDETLVKQKPAPPPMLETQPLDVPEIIGRGSEKHVQIQNSIKSLANQYGWKADIEHQVQDGFVDVWLERQGFSIACEITATTPIDYELQNIEKCRKTDTDEIWVISENLEKLADIERKLANTANVYFFTPDNLPSEIEARSDMEPTDSLNVRGFTVSVKKAYVSDTDLQVRQARLNHLIKNTRL